METFEIAPLTRRFEEAPAYAARLQAQRRRKRTEVPYVAHLLAVCALVLEDGGSEDEAIRGPPPRRRRGPGQHGRRAGAAR